MAKRKVNTNGLPPGHPNAPAPGIDIAGAVRDVIEDQAYEERERAKRLGLNCFTSKAPWFVGGNNENNE